MRDGASASSPAHHAAGPRPPAARAPRSPFCRVQGPFEGGLRGGVTRSPNRRTSTPPIGCLFGGGRGAGNPNADESDGGPSNNPRDSSLPQCPAPHLGVPRASFERRGVWDPRVCVPKMVRPDLSDGKRRFVPRWSLWSGGGGRSNASPPPPQCACLTGSGKAKIEQRNRVFRTFLIAQRRC